jgi:hypothetical protein
MILLSRAHFCLRALRARYTQYPALGRAFAHVPRGY